MMKGTIFAILLLTFTATVSARPSNRWPVIFHDNFNGPLNLKKWGYVIRNPGWVNGEKQAYNYKNAFTYRGVLNIRLIKHGSKWYSSRLTTKNKFRFAYGRIDARIRCDRVAGPFPAVWALAEHHSRWPENGEIDLFEMQTKWNYIPSSLHFPARHGGNSLSYKDYDVNTSRWRVYSMEWTPTRITFYHDNRRIGQYNRPRRFNPHNWPYTGNNKFNLIINNAMHPSWGSAPKRNLREHILQVDYITVRSKWRQ